MYLLNLYMARYGDTQTHMYVLGKGLFFWHLPNECDDKADRGKSEKNKRKCKKQEGNLIHSKYYCHCYQTSNTDTMHAVVQ